ncbi:nucleotidyltransferase domain-containing protein [Candidatus Woesearchaeota archaeon]|nr:nucleotidyltransferase domain-containing protein [Candidatus Woesearchaeota archaeon]
MVGKKHLEYLKAFKKQLSKEIPVQKMYLFGSRVKGRPHRWSDFDLIIVSERFKDKASFKRSIGFHKYWTIDYPVDFLCYTPEEFKKLSKQITIIREAVREGISI